MLWLDLARTFVLPLMAHCFFFNSAHSWIWSGLNVLYERITWRVSFSQTYDVLCFSCSVALLSCCPYLGKFYTKAMPRLRVSFVAVLGQCPPLARYHILGTVTRRAEHKCNKGAVHLQL
jgi:hypothetical protein